MMRIKDAQKRHISLVIKLSDILTGNDISGGRDIMVISDDGLQKPVVKPDGYFVFTDCRPDCVKIVSKSYHDVQIPVDGHIGGVLRFALVPRIRGGRTITVPDGAYVGFSAGYALAEALDPDKSSILLRKEDFADLTDLYHAIVTPSGAKESVFLQSNLGGGRYSLREKPLGAYPSRTTRAVALYKTVGGEIPMPPKAEKIYTMSDGTVAIMEGK